MLRRPFPPRRDAGPGPLFRGEVVTVCIAAVCPALGRIVWASDSLISSETAAVEGAVKMAEIKQYGAKWMVLFAGDAHRFRALVEHAQRLIAGGTLPHVMDAFSDAYKIELLKRIETEILLPYGWTRDEFLDKGRERLGDARFGLLVDQITQTKLSIDLLIAGFSDDGGMHMFQMDAYGVSTRIDQVRFHAIGVGANAAFGALYPVSYIFDEREPEQIVYRMCAAKFSAEAVPGVGEMTFLGWRDRNGAVGLLLPAGVGQLRLLWKQLGQPPVPPDAVHVIRELALGLVSATAAASNPSPQKVQKDDPGSGA